MASKLSYAGGHGDLPLIYGDLPSLLDAISEETPHKLAHVFRYLKEDSESREVTRETVTFRELTEKSISVAAHLLDMGLEPGDTIAIAGPNCPEWAYLEYACLRIKVVMIRVPMMFLNEEGLVRLLSKYTCHALVLGEELIQRLGSFVTNYVGGNLPIEAAEKLENLKQVMLLREEPILSDLSRSFRSITAIQEFTGDKSRVAVIQATLDTEEIAIVLPTSGSTGESKFAAHTHFTAVNGTKGIFSVLNLDEPGSVMSTDRPFSWLGGYIFTPVVFKTTMVFIDSKITSSGKDFDLVYKIMEEEKVTASLMMAYVLFDAMHAKEKGILPPESLQYVLTGGERTPQVLMEFARETFRVLALVYGSTECMNLCRGIISKNNELDTGSLTCLGYYPHFEVKIVGNDGKVLPRGQRGNMRIRSVCTMKGYFRDPEATAAIKNPDGWVDPGDIGLMHDQGYMEIVGRSKDVISRGSQKIYPKVVEDILIEHPLVAKVMVAGVPDPRLFQEVCACVIPTEDQAPTEAQLREFYQANILADAFSPKYYLFMAEFPKGHTGKFDRRTLAAQAAHKLGLGTDC